jgi:putative ABC transport system permease protein
MAMSVRERVREVGILKTLGYTPGAILGIILAEAVTIALIGGVIGLGLASLICGALRQSPTTFVDLKALEIPVSVGALCLLVAALVGLLSCAVPAWSASRRSIIDSLRFTD